MTFVAHWDDVEVRRLDVGPLHASWQDLGRAAGSVGCSVKREMIDPGGRPTPAHSHGSDEEFFHVLSGSGLSWQDGVTHAIGPGDCLLHRAAEAAHTLIAGDDGLEVLVFGTEADTSLTRLPRAAVFWAGPWWIADDAGPARPFVREPEEIEHAPGPRPDTTIHFSEGVHRHVQHGGTDVTYLDVGRKTGSVSTGLRHATLAPGKSGPPPHCHSAEHELFVILDGDGTLLLGDTPHPVRRGSVVARPPGTGVPHQLTAGAQGLEYLAWSTRDSNDMAYMVRSNKVYFRGLQLLARVEPLGYWDGEE